MPAKRNTGRVILPFSQGYLVKQIAIIGSGPAGCFLADQLLRLAKDVRIDIIERLPVPFGLVRYGVAPDHQGTKAVTRLLDRVLARDPVRFFGHVEVGRDVTLDELQQMYDVVVLATGAPRDRRPGIPGQDLPGVAGSAAFVGWYNSHPDHRPPELRDVRSVVVIGNGNVAIDVARILAKTPDELAGSDLSPAAHAALQQQSITEIHVVGRRGPADARFTHAELAELGRLAGASTRIAEPELLDEARVATGATEDGQAGGKPANADIIEVLRGFAQDERDCPVRIVFHFGATPAAFEGRERLETVRFERRGREPLILPAQLAITCIGYESVDCCRLAPERGFFANDDARISDGLYVTGWAGRGPSGTIPVNRTEAQRVAQRIAAELEDHGRGGGEALAALLTQRGVEIVDHASWRRIDAAEIGRAAAQRCRHKFEAVDAMLAVVRTP